MSLYLSVLEILVEYDYAAIVSNFGVDLTNLNTAYLSDLLTNSDLTCAFPESPTYDFYIDNTFSIFHTSVPNIKLYYPEPFIATPTFVHDDIWFVHIVIYQYWLWFGFVYMIIFFFLAFLITVRWCNVRHRPVRETRGVSRSKCGDLITATVPVSWAASIIIHESTDAIELSDGFGTAEMAVGIRAYQWGWEYYYPKDMDLKFYNQKSLLVGKSSSNFFNSSVEPSHNRFKSALLTSDIIDAAGITSLHCLDKDLGPKLNQYMQGDSTVGLNKLVARAATSLITSPKLLNANNLIKSQNTSVFDDLIAYYWSNVWEDSISSKPEYATSSTNFLSAKDLFFFNNACSNLNDINLYLQVRNSKHSDPLFETMRTAFLFGNTNEGVNSWNLNLLPTQCHLSLDLLKTIPSGSPVPHAITTTPCPMLKSFLNAEAWKSLARINNTSHLPFSLYADQDFKRWSAHEMIEDLSWADYSGNTSAFSDNKLSLELHPELFNLNSYRPLFANYAVTQLTLAPSKPFIFDYKFVVFNDFFRKAFNSSFLLFKQPLLSDLNLIITSRNAVQPSSQLDTFSYFSNFDQTVGFKQDYSYFSFLDSMSSNLDQLVNNSYTDHTLLFKNFITYYQAFWKVYKSTIDEERTLFKLSNYSNTEFRLPLIMQAPSALMSLIQKTNVEQFYSISFFTKVASRGTLPFTEQLSSYFSYQFPFMLSFESDVIRYTWFDWYSFKSLVVAKSADTSVFGLNGSKQYEFSFTKDPKSETLNRIDNYVTNYNSARKFLLPNSMYTPFFYAKFNELNPLTLLRDFAPESVFKTKTALLSFNMLLVLDANPDSVNTFNPRGLNQSFSVQYTPNHNFYFTYKTLSNKFDYFNMLLDTMSKRNYLMKNFSGLSEPTPTSTPLWAILRDLPVNSANPKLSFMRGYRDYAKSTTLKSQYVPLKKGIVNMIRIQADKAIAMPTDTRLQILAVSKDIIHSWSIPSAGIKIDCIPGYSSHRIAMFTVSGIYWGQCMEICGRFHHWMPIVVYFLRRDLFCLWCTHFIFNNKQVNSLYQGYDGRMRDSDLLTYASTSAWNYAL